MLRKILRADLIVFLDSIDSSMNYAKDSYVKSVWAIFDGLVIIAINFDSVFFSLNAWPGNLGL